MTKRKPDRVNETWILPDSHWNLQSELFLSSQYDRTNQHLPFFCCHFLSSPLQYTILNSAFISILKRSSVNRFRSEFDRPGKETRFFSYWLAQLAKTKEGSSAETRCRVKEGNVLTSAFPPAISSSCQALFLKAKHVPAPPGRAALSANSMCFCVQQQHVKKVESVWCRRSPRTSCFLKPSRSLKQTGESLCWWWGGRARVGGEAWVAG